MVAEEAWETAEIAENELPQTASEFADIAVAQVNHYVNVRQEPDTESEILGNTLRQIRSHCAGDDGGRVVPGLRPEM